MHKNEDTHTGREVHNSELEPKHTKDTYSFKHSDLLLDSEVDYDGLCGNLWCVVGVRQLGGYVETELWTVLHLLITQLQQQPATWSKAHLIVHPRIQATPDI